METDKLVGDRIEGPTPNGGAYAIKYEHDGSIEIVEYDDLGEPIFRTYADQ